MEFPKDSLPAVPYTEAFPLYSLYFLHGFDQSLTLFIGTFTGITVPIWLMMGV